MWATLYHVSNGGPMCCLRNRWYKYSKLRKWRKRFTLPLALKWFGWVQFNPLTHCVWGNNYNVSYSNLFYKLFSSFQFILFIIVTSMMHITIYSISYTPYTGRWAYLSLLIHDIRIVGFHRHENTFTNHVHVIKYFGVTLDISTCF